MQLCECFYSLSQHLTTFCNVMDVLIHCLVNVFFYYFSLSILFFLVIFFGGISGCSSFLVSLCLLLFLLFFFVILIGFWVLFESILILLARWLTIEKKSIYYFNLDLKLLTCKTCQWMIGLRGFSTISTQCFFSNFFLLYPNTTFPIGSEPPIRS